MTAPANSADRAPVTVVAVADGCGIGGAPDADAYRTSRANTLRHVAETAGELHLPTLGRWGLGNICDIVGTPAVPAPEATVAAAVMSSAGNDTPTGHWELFGRPTTTAPVVHPDGFSDELLDELMAAWDVDGVLANRAVGGLVVLDEWGGTHTVTGRPIVYTSADSVLQVAANLDVVPIERLYQWCAAARVICDDRWPIGRIIARPFRASGDDWERLSGLRRDWAVPAPADGAIDRLHAAAVPVVAVGKIGDIFAHRGFTDEVHPDTYQGCMDAAADAAAQLRADRGGVVVVNLTEFDYRGHARDAAGFADAVRSLDVWLGELETSCAPSDQIVICADHGNDPTHTVDDTGAAHLDHTRERIPYLRYTAGRTGRQRDDVPMSTLGIELCEHHGVTDTQLGQPR